MINNDTINRFIFHRDQALLSQATALILRSLAQYSIYRDQVCQLDPAAATVVIEHRKHDIEAELPGYAELATCIPMFPQDIKQRLCQEDYIQLVGAYVLATLRKGV